MSIHLIIGNSDARPSDIEGRGWLVQHPSNDAILAYCDTEKEANEVRKALADLAKRLATAPLPRQRRGRVRTERAHPQT
jgi:hypothetical protein